MPCARCTAVFWVPLHHRSLALNFYLLTHVYLKEQYTYCYDNAKYMCMCKKKTCTLETEHAHMINYAFGILFPTACCAWGGGS